MAWAKIGCLLMVAATVTGCATSQTGGRVDNTRLLNAIDIDDVSYVRGAVQGGSLTANERVPAPAYPDGAPLIAVAARAGALQTLRYLISAGANVNDRTPVNETPLMLASFFYDRDVQGPRAFDRHEQAAKLLIDAGASLENPHTYQYTPLAYAAFQGNERLVRYLIERGARVNNIAPNGVAYANTPLMMAAIQGNESVARMLLRAGADADIRVTGGGHTASELAAKYRHANLARLLQCAERQSQYSLSAECRSMLGYDPATRAAGSR